MTIICDELVCSNNYRVGVITLASPQTLNALSLPMVHEIFMQLQRWEEDPLLSCVFITSIIPKAFSAGGDIRQVVESCRQHPGESDKLAKAFFSAEYQLDDYVHHYPKPIIGWGQGYALGGGLGLLQGCSIRIATPSSRFGMPEMNIGFFPDVGGAWFLSRIPEKLGLFIALTATQVNAADALQIGWADRFMLDTQKDELLQGLQQIDWQHNAEQQLHQLIKGLEQVAIGQLPETFIMSRKQTIKAALDHADLPSIWHAIVALKDTPDAFLINAAQTLEKGCTSTAWIIWEQLRRLGHRSVSEVLQMDYIVSLNCCRFNDFTEGVRAVLIDRDQKPNWQWKRIEDVPFDIIEQHFQPCWD